MNDRERWRRCNWGYPQEFVEAEKEYLGIATEQQPVTPERPFQPDKALKDRLDSMNAELRASVNRMNSHLDYSKKNKGVY